jgi:hypothetical protein
MLDFLAQYFASDISRLTKIEIVPDLETSTSVEYKQVTITSIYRDVREDLVKHSVNEGMLMRWKGYLKKDETAAVPG